MTTETHVHHWILNDTGYGRCKGCHEERQFINDWIELAPSGSWLSWRDVDRDMSAANEELRQIREQFRQLTW